jgi:hypothetical protein
MRCLERITEGQGSKMFLFKTFRESAAPGGTAGHMLIQPWDRVGFAPLDFTK